MIANLELAVLGAAIGGIASATILAAGASPEIPGPSTPIAGATRTTGTSDTGPAPAAGPTAPVRSRRTERDPVVVAVVAVVLAATATFVSAAAWWSAPATLLAGAVGLGLGARAGQRAEVAPAVVLNAALAAAVALYLLLPDTEGTMLVGGALVPLAVVASVRPRPWTADAAIAAIGALAGLLVAVAVTAAARRWSTLAVALTTAVVVAALVALAVSLAIGSLTSERGRPSR